LINAENFRRLGHASDSFEDFTQMRFLKFLQRNQRADLRQIFTGRGYVCSLTAQFDWKIFWGKLVVSGQNDRAFDGIAQFAQIVRSGMRPGARDGFDGKSFQFATALSGEKLFIMPGEAYGRRFNFGISHPKFFQADAVPQRIFASFIIKPAFAANDEETPFSSNGATCKPGI
jgi:hypothetical protein